jgi:hypothetical protein
LLNRREFIGLLGAGALTKPGRVRTTGMFPGYGLGSTPAPGPTESKAYGSGHFGEWITDQFGLPAYRYTCDQTSDPTAQTPVHKEWRSATDHTHQVGNDRLLAAVSNYGYLQVRQDEGSPKFLNDYSPEHGYYGAGIGFLTDGKILLSTYYAGNRESFERIFGAGYFRKTVRGGGYEIDQVIFAPFGDDPVLISQVAITNHTANAVELRWVEYWGCQIYQFSYRSFMVGASQGGRAIRAADLRHRLGERFEHKVQALEGSAGIIETKRFLGRTPEDEQGWNRLRGFLKTNPNTFLGGPFPEPAAGADFEDLNPPATFLVSLDAPASGIASNAKAFFGSGGVEHPSGLSSRLDNDLTATGPEGALLLERVLQLRPGESRTLYIMYGYLPEGFTLAALKAKYHANPPALWSGSSAKWKADGLRLNVPAEPWVARETAWHNYYLRSSLTYDSFFREHILSQGHIYQYVMGFQGAARDPLQHAMPFVFSRPEIVREVLRYTLKEIQPDGSIPYGIVGSGVPMPVQYRPSDQEMWLLWLAAEYVLASRDRNFLDERIPAYPRRDVVSGDPTIREMLRRCYRHLVDVIGAGQHGLMRLSNGDWNDGVVVGNISSELHAEIREHGESVLNAAMACYVLDHYGRLLTFSGESKLAAEAQAKAEAQRHAVRDQWAGAWFRRAWLGAQLGWTGEKQVWLEPQPWAIIGGAATPEQSAKLVDTLDRLVRKPSPIGAMLHSERMAQMGMAPGMLTNGGIWPSINGTLIWALALTDGAQAWDEWKKNSLALHAEAYPDIWYGIWSGPDSYNSTLSRHPGQTMFTESASGGPPQWDWGVNWTDFPVMNMHPHAWPLYSAVKLLGVEFNESGLSLKPSLPLDEYEFTSPLLGLKKSARGYSGWYAPVEAGRWKIRLSLAPAERERIRRLEVNGAARTLARSSETVIRFLGEGGPGKPLRWAVS